MTEFKRKEPSSSRWKRWEGKVIEQGRGGKKANLSRNKHKRERRASTKSKNISYFNCGKPSNFARDCIESKVLYDQTRVRVVL